MGGDQVNLAICLRNLRRLEESLDQTEKAIDNLQAMNQRFPEHRQSAAFFRNARNCHAQTLDEFGTQRLCDTPSPDELAVIIQDSINACELTQWKHEGYVSTLVMALYRSVSLGNELESMLNQVPKKYQANIQEQIKQPTESEI